MKICNTQKIPQLIPEKKKKKNYIYVYFGIKSLTNRLHGCSKEQNIFTNTCGQAAGAETLKVFPMCFGVLCV